ncbi:MAG TPA: hypothetical protein VJ814_11010 [Gaiellaceae bacterium]|nr:hypothetical protein [Gaiellaceae bacterium]
MRTSNALERLAAAGRPLLADTVPLVDEAEENRILERILASSRAPARPRTMRRLRPALLAGIVVVGAIVGAAAGGAFSHSKSAAPRPSGHQPHLALSGARIQLAGYHFRTPAGFKASKSDCIPAPAADNPQPSIDGFAAAASADGGCVEGVYFVAADWLQSQGLMPDASDAVDIGNYLGFYVPPAASGEKSALYVNLPDADGSRVVYLVLYARGVTEDQLIAIAESGLPTLPPSGPTATTGTETTG